MTCCYTAPVPASRRPYLTGLIIVRDHSVRFLTTYTEGRTMEKNKCPVFVDGQECGLELRQVETEGRIYQCPLGHRSSFFPSLEQRDPPRIKATYRKRRNSSVWHFCSNCPGWPTLNFTEMQSPKNSPTDGLCRRCISLLSEKKCSGWDGA